MTVADWLAMAKADAIRRGLPDLVPALEGLARSTEALRAADWSNAADGATPPDDAVVEGRDEDPGRGR